MTIKEMEEFCVICQRGSLAKASKELFMSPQGLSKVVKNLEAELGCTLLNRTKQGLELTESGEIFQNYVSAVLEKHEEMKKSILNVQQSTEGTIELLSAYDVIRYLAPESILEFQRIYPNITFTFKEYPDRMVEQFLLEKQGNVALSIGPFSKECFGVYELCKCKMGALVHRDHKLADRKEISIKDLENVPLYLENAGFKLNEIILRKCWEHGFEPNIIFETTGFDLCYKMCRQKKGISVTIDFVHEDLKTEDVVFVPFSDSDLFWEIGLLINKDEAMTPSVEKLYRFIENIIPSTSC